MSDSPTSSSYSDRYSQSDPNQTQKRESSSFSLPGPSQAGGPADPVVPLKRRGARACVACRRGKNRCEGDSPCRRCANAGIACVFEKPAPKAPKVLNGNYGDANHAGEERVNRLESEVTKINAAQGSMQNTLTQILAALTPQQPQLQQPTYQQHQLPPISDSYSQSSLGQPSFTLPTTLNQHQYPLPSLGLPAMQHHTPQDAPSPNTQAWMGMSIPALATSPNPSTASPSSVAYDRGLRTTSASTRTSDWPAGRTDLSSSTSGETPSTMFSHWPSPRDGSNAGGGGGGGMQDDRGVVVASGSTSGSNGSAGIRFQVEGVEGGGVQGSPERERQSKRSWERSGREGKENGGRGSGEKSFPPLPGFAPPPTHKFAAYGIIPSTAVSSEDESEDTLPRASLMAPSLALEGLANAAAEAASGALSPPRVMRMKKRKRAEPPPRNAFPDVVTKGMVSEAEARELYNIFFSGSHLFVPLFDPTYDTLESIRERTPFTFDGMLAIAAKVRAGSGPPGPTFQKCFEEAQGIARSTLFGPVVRKEAVQATLLLATHSQNGWLPSGHALRMGLDIGLHRALEKLHNGPADGEVPRSEEDERDLVVSSRIWLCLFWFDRLMSLGTGRPILLRDDESVAHARFLLTHSMSSSTDVRLVSQLELVILKTRVYDHLQPLKGKVDHHTLAYIRRVYADLDSWFSEWDQIKAKTYAEDSVLRKMLLVELHYAKLWVVCVALRGASWDRMPYEQREIAFEAKEAAMRCLDVYLRAQQFRSALKFAVHESMVMGTFAACYLLKVAILFPSEIDTHQVLAQVEELAGLLSEISAERYALTLRLMITSFKRRFAMTVPSTPRMDASADSSLSHLLLPGGSTPNNGTVNGVDPFGWGAQDLPEFEWPEGMENFSPRDLPLWLQDSSLTDLGLPAAGSDSIFLPHELGPMVGGNAWNFLLDPSQLNSAAW